jgi:hypothetical protein
MLMKEKKGPHTPGVCSQTLLQSPSVIGTEDSSLHFSLRLLLLSVPGDPFSITSLVTRVRERSILEGWSEKERQQNLKRGPEHLA